MRAVFQAQPDVSHVYLGSKRHLLRRIFSDKNEPFWRSAKQLEIGVIPPERSAVPPARFDESGKRLAAEAAARLLASRAATRTRRRSSPTSSGSWCRTGARHRPRTWRTALGRVLRSEHNHLVLMWDDAPRPQRLLLLALADEPVRAVYSADYASRHDLPPTPTLQRALSGLVQKEIVAQGRDGEYRIVEPFLAEWLRREEAPRARRFSGGERAYQGHGHRRPTRPARL